MLRVENEYDAYNDGLGLDDIKTKENSAAQSIGIDQNQDRLTNPNVICVGAGPVGLFTAIQLKLANPSLKILMLEKYPEFQRKHPLLIDSDSYDNANTDPEFQAFIRSLPTHIRTNELQAELLKYAKKLGIVIEYKAVDNCEQLAAEYPETEVVIGSGGSHDIVHKQVFNDEYQYKNDLRFISEVKYEVHGKTRPLNLLTEAAPAHGFTNHLVSEFVGKEKNGITPVSLRIFINEETYKTMQPATFKKPYKMESRDKFDQDLYQTIINWFKARADLAGEKRVADSEKVTATNLPIYAAKDFVIKRHGKIWIKVGDGACGVPYFRSLNMGFICASELAKCLSAHFNGKLIFEEPDFSKSISKRQEGINPFKYYSNFVQNRFETEKTNALWKDFGVSLLESGALSERTMPLLAVSKLSSTREGRLFKTHMKEADNGPKRQEATATRSKCTIL